MVGAFRSGWRRAVGMVAIHALLFALGFFLAHGLRWGFRLTWELVTIPFVPLLIASVVIKLVVFWRCRLYRGWWRYTGLYDLLTVVSASLISSFLLILSWWVGGHIPWIRDHWLTGTFSQQTFVLDPVAAVALVSLSRISVRLYFESVRVVPPGGTASVLLIGAGDTTEAVLREIERMPEARYRIVGLLDDDSATWGREIHGYRVMGGTEQIREICSKQSVDEILIALHRPDPRELRRVVERCEGTNVRFRIVPDVQEVIAGRVRMADLPEINISDLLGREEVSLDTALIGSSLKGLRVMVTGAGGSIGSEMCRQIIRFEPAELVLVEQSENPLFEIERELTRRKPDGVVVTAHVADICDRARMTQIFSQHKPAVVFHAAAHKHVPMMERNPGEAVKNNILGTKTVADAAVAAGVCKMVMISTDKAVRPTSIMGCTKRVAEMYVQQLSARSETHFVTVRFGNVLGSSGSVVPIFQEQIASGGPVTVTHPEMTRYFMTIPEACQLVMQAGAMGQGGQICVLDMGEPVKIVDLAKELITLSGFTPGEDIEIAFTGVRPGEKLYEELSIEGEDVARTTHPKIGIWQNKPESFEAVCAGIDDLLRLADDGDGDRIRRRLSELVPEYQMPVG